MGLIFFFNRGLFYCPTNISGFDVDLCMELAFFFRHKFNGDVV